MLGVLSQVMILFGLMDWSPPGSSVHGTSQPKILAWTAFLSPGDLLDSGIEPASSVLQFQPLLSHCVTTVTSQATSPSPRLFPSALSKRDWVSYSLIAITPECSLYVEHSAKNVYYFTQSA